MKEYDKNREFLKNIGIKEKYRTFYHHFKARDKYFFFDVESSKLYELSEIAYRLAENSFNQSEFIDEFSIKEIQEAQRELEDIISKEYLTKTSHAQCVHVGEEISFLWLGVSHRCNLNCSYCFLCEDLNERDDDLMTFDVAKKSVDYLVEMSGDNKNLKIIFFGGEPLLNFNLIKEVVLYCKEVGLQTKKKFTFSLTTNGTLLSKPIFKWLKENGVGIMLSIDGRKEIHDRFRRTRDGRPTWNWILQNMRQIPNFGQHIPARVTITPEDVNLVNIYQTLRSLGFQDLLFAEICPNSGDPPEFPEDKLQGLKREYWRLIDFLLEKCSTIEDIALVGLRDLINTLRYGHKSYYCCHTGIYGYYVTPNGILLPCCRMISTEDKYEIGDIHNGVKEDRRKLFVDNHIYNRLCSTCWAKYICGGQCHSDCYSYKGNISEPNILWCEIMKEKIYCASYLLSYFKERS